MRSRRAAREDVAEVARRRLELLSAELAGLRCDEPPPPTVPAASASPLADETRGRHARRSVGIRERAAGWVHDRLPPTLQGRVQLGSSHLGVVAVLVVAALAAAGWWFLRADASGTLLGTADASQSQTTHQARSASQPTEGAGGPAGLVTLEGGAAGTGEPAATPGGPATGSSPRAGPSPTGRIVVDVAGKVRRPGIASLPAGARVVDALRAAGGPRPGVGLVGLNLARVLTDGEQIVVGLRPPGGVAAPAVSSPDVAPPGATPLVNLNTATETELETLPQVGPVTAAAILEWRTRNGAFSAVDELLEVSGIGDATLAKIAPFVTL